MTQHSTPLYFESHGESLFAWMHRPPDGARADLGVVICKPFGYESICAHRSLLAFADAAAAGGAFVLRFDYSGTGDSTGSDADDDQITRWRADIVAAIAELRRRAGVRRICLLGMRLGALLAGAVASDVDVEALLAVAPVADGRRYLRELRAYQAGANARGFAGPRDGGVEVTGFSLSGAAVERLSAIDLARMPIRVARTLILDRDDLPAAGAWADSLARAGAAADYRLLPGFLEMVSSPHASRTPQQMLAAIAGWIGELSERAPAYRADERPAGRCPPPAAQAPSAAEASTRMTTRRGAALQERAFCIGGDRSLFAVVTSAAAGGSTPAQSTHGSVILNCGATSHVGPNRMSVELARAWADRGHVVLRLDLPGLGDSAARAGGPENEVYPTDAVADIRRAIDYLRREHGVSNVTLTGLCSGAYHALRSAIEELPANALLMINPLTFHWAPGSTLSDLQVSEVVRNPRIYSERLWDWSAWRRLLRGRVNLWRVGAIYAHRVALGIESVVRDVGRRFGVYFPNDLGRDLEALADRGVRIVFVFARGDGGEELLRLQAGKALHRLGDRSQIYVLDGADHIFSQSGPRRDLIRLLNGELPVPAPERTAAGD